MILTALLEQILLYIPLLLGAYLSMALMKIPSLSIESAYLMGAVCGGLCATSGHPILSSLPVIISASLLGGALVGLIVSFLVEKALFSQLFAAIVCIGFFQGLIQLIIQGIHLSLSSTHNPLMYFPSLSSYPMLSTIVIISFCSYICYTLFLKTELGLSCAIYGANPKFFANYRMNSSYIVTMGLMISNGFAGISGYLIAQTNGFVDLYMGLGLPLLCLSALIIGKVLYQSTKPIAPFIPIGGTIGYFIIQTGLLQIGFDLRYFTAIQAVIIAIILSFSSRFMKESDRQALLGV